jgi:hypothetical protein
MRRTPDLSHVIVGITGPIQKRDRERESKELNLKTDDNQTHLAGGDWQLPWQPSLSAGHQKFDDPFPTCETRAVSHVQSSYD